MKFILLLSLFSIFCQAQTSSKWIPTVEEKNKIESIFPRSAIHFEEAYNLLFLPKKGVAALIVQPEGSVPMLVLFEGGAVSQKIQFSNTLRVSSLKKIEAISFKDNDRDGLLDILILAQFKFESEAAKNQPPQSVGQFFRQGPSSTFVLDEEKTKTGVTTIADYVKSFSNIPPQKLSDLGVKSGADYPEAKKHLLKSGWKESVSDDATGRVKNAYPEINCGNGAMAVCSAVFNKGEMLICLGIRSTKSCKSGFCVENLEGCG